MRRTTTVEPSEPVEPAPPLSHVIIIKGHHARGANPVEPSELSEPVEPKQVKKTTLSGSLFCCRLIYPSRLFLYG